MLKKISRFYQASDLKIASEVALSEVNHRHAIQVLRLKTDDFLIVFNGKGGEFLARLIDVKKRSSCIVLESFDAINRESSLSSTIFLAMIKPDKMDFAIQKMVELGVAEIQPIYTKRSVIKIKANRLEKKMQHWQGVVIAACEQSGRTAIPIIHQPKSLIECLENQYLGDFLVMLPESQISLIELKKTKPSMTNISLFIGPEGGFTSDEELLMQSKGATAIRVGGRVLRAETAAIAGLTACQLLWGDLGGCPRTKN